MPPCNKAFLMKVGWSLVASKNAQWAHVVHSKYKCGDDLVPNVRVEKQGSRVWSGIKVFWKNVQEGIHVVITRTGIVE